MTWELIQKITYFTKSLLQYTYYKKSWKSSFIYGFIV